MTTLENIQVTATHGEHVVTFDFCPTDGDIDTLREQAAQAIEDETGETVTPSAIQLEIDDWGDMPKDYQTLEDYWQFAEACAESDQDTEVIEAALYLGISPSDIDEAYSGNFSSDEDFAREFADQIDAIDRNATWPQNCIDWEYAAKELMYDYAEHNGHYFRNF